MNITSTNRKQIYDAIEHEAQFNPNAVDVRKVANGSGFTVEEVCNVVSCIGYNWVDAWIIDTKVINA